MEDGGVFLLGMAQADGDGVPLGQIGQQVQVFAPDPVGHQVRTVRQDDRVVLGADLRNEESVTGGDIQTPSLADGVVVNALVLTQNLSLSVHKVPGRGRGAVGIQPGGVVPVRDEADLHAVGLVRHGDAVLMGQVPDLGLFQAANGEDQTADHLLRETGQHIGLVVSVGTTGQKGFALLVFDLGVVAGGHEVCPDFIGIPEEGGELHGGVAPGAGQRGPPFQIIPLEGAHDLVFQLLTDVPGGEGDVQPCGHGLGILSATQTDIQPVTVDLPALVQENAGGHGGVHAAREAQNHFLIHGSTPQAARQGRP